MKIKLFTIPNMLTLSNLLCGSFAVVSALVYRDLELSFWLIILAAVFDFFDGFAARLLHIPSAIGVELDSLADMISFGLAPAAIFYTLYADAATLWTWSEQTLWIGSWCVFILAAFSALRLAKFNIDDTQTTEFCGLPTPACALFCASLGLLTVQGSLEMSKEVIVAVAVIFACLLISPVRMFSFKFHGFGWHGNALRYLFMVGCVMLIVWLHYVAVPLIIVSYIVISAVRWIRMRCASKSCAKA
ncbi:MAG: CDP-alcohol phosphatidyltransferase family protein [Alistipes sp.]